MAGYKNNKKSFLDSFIPRKGDSSADITRKIVTVVSVAVLVVALVILAWYFVQQAKISKNSRKCTRPYRL